MLVEPDLDAARLKLDRALAKALANRVAAGSLVAPDAEAIALRLALAHAWEPADEALLKAVWARIGARKAAPLVVAGAEAAVLAADRYGLSFQVVADTDGALVQVAAGARALIDLGGPRPWWGKLLARPELQVISALPDDRRGVPRALLVSMEKPGPTGEDRTFWITDSGLSDARIVEALSACGFVGKPLASASGLKLFMLAGYVQAEDGRLLEAPGSLSGVIGSAPLF